MKARTVANSPVERWRLQYTLRTLFLVATLCAVIASVIAAFPAFFVEAGPIFFLLWLLYLPISLVSCGPLWWFGRKRVSHWCMWDYLVLVMPYLFWMTFILLNDSGKSLSNLVEPLWLALATGLAPLGRIVLGKIVPSRNAALGVLLLMCAVAVGLWAFVPALPE